MWIGVVVLAATPAWADEVEPNEEIIVWGDRFQRWERRWFVETELKLVAPMRLYGWANDQLDIMGYRLTAVLDCDKDFVLTDARWEVSCRFEDVALIVAPGRQARDAVGVVQQIDATLTGARFQLQVHERGGVPNIDLEDSGETHTRRHRVRQEQLRQLISRAIVPFHLKLPETIHPEMKWPEYNSQLLTMPVPLTGDDHGDQTASLGGTLMTHTMTPYAGHFLVQSIGKGVVSAGAGYFDLRMDGVALFEPDTGILTERVWSVAGTNTAGLGNTMYVHHGRISMLGTDDAPDVGLTGVLAN